MAQNLQCTVHIHDDFNGQPFRAKSIRPAPGFQATFEIHLVALFQELCGDIGQPVIDNHPVPLCALLMLAGLFVAPALRCGDGKQGDGLFIGGVADLRILAEITDDAQLI